MTGEEFMQVWVRATDLFPKWDPTQSQMEVWKVNLQRHRIDDVMKSLNEHFAVSKLNTPNLGAVMVPLKRETPAPVKTQEEFDKYCHQKNQEENDQTDWDLSDYTDADFEDCKAAILANEPMREWMKDLPAKGRAWRDLIYERFVHNRVAIYKRGQAAPAAWMTRDEYWARWAAQKKKLAEEVAESRKKRMAADKELATLSEVLMKPAAGGVR